MTHRDFLRDATQNAHARAEAQWVAGYAFANAETYQGWLRTMLQVHARQGLGAAYLLADDSLIACELHRLRVLKADLGQHADIAGLPRGRSTSWAWGVQYVLNGSALGAATMLKTGGIDAAWPRAYAQAMQTFARSGALKAFFSNLDKARLDPDEALLGATETFELAARCPHANAPHSEAACRD